MKILFLALLVACLTVGTNCYSQSISLQVQNSPLEKIFKEIERQTDFRFVYTREQVEGSKPVSLTIKSSLNDVLSKCFQNQPLSYTIDGKYILVKFTDQTKRPNDPRQIDGQIVNEQGEPLGGATISVKSTGVKVYSDESGRFTLNASNANEIVVVSLSEMETSEFKLSGHKTVVISLKQKIAELDQPIVIGYGSTTRRYSVGSVSKIDAKEIATQPVSNVLSALQGRVPGLVVTSTGGVPGAAVTVQVRGQNSLNPTATGINPVDQPLFIIDGVPFAPQNANISQYPSLASPGTNETWGNPYGGLSPFATMNPSDIESIEVLKDADATAIYGSRGSNGVILITSKKGFAGKSKFTMTINTGSSRVTRTMEMMNTKQYLAMRREAFMNDGIAPTAVPGPAYAPDLMVFDSIRNVGWTRELLGNTAVYTDVNASLSGGNAQTKFLIAGGYHRETFIFPGDFKNQRFSINTNINHVSANKRFTFSLTTAYTYARNESSGNETLLRTAITLAPNYPELKDESGNLNLDYRGIMLNENPLGFLKQKSFMRTYNLNTSVQAGFKLLKNLSFQLSGGYNNYRALENAQRPKVSYNPAVFDRSRSYFGNNNFETFLLEPRLEYKQVRGLHDLTVMVGSTYQKNTNYSTSITAENYQDDALLGSITAAGIKTVTDAYSRYLYAGTYARIGYVLNKRYILSLNGRRDGSSRFGDGNQFGNFGSVGAGWIFTEHLIARNRLPFLTYGKLKFNYGTTGSDGIGNYQFIPRWAAGNYSYQGSLVYLPQNLYNPGFHWSLTKKLDIGVDVGLFKNRILLNLDWYMNRTSNQLILESVPNQTGFANVTANFPAVVQNKGLELSIQSVNITTTKFEWKSRFNLTIQAGKLKAFEGLDRSAYATIYTIGQSTRQIRKYIFTGLNDTTGLYTFADINKDGLINAADLQIAGDLEPDFTGGLSNSFSYKGLYLDVFFEFRKQIGPIYLQQAYTLPAGSYNNLPTTFLDRWQKPGDQAALGRLTTSQGSLAGRANLLYRNSNAAYGDASYLRCKTVALSYTVPERFMKKLKVESCRFFINAQNLFVITGYEGHDPETMSFYGVPPLKTFVTGLQFTL